VEYSRWNRSEDREGGREGKVEESKSNVRRIDSPSASEVQGKEERRE
jgi:hypothetical protein